MGSLKMSNNQTKQTKQVKKVKKVVKALKKVAAVEALAGTPAQKSLRANPAAKIRGKGDYITDLLSSIGHAGLGIGSAVSSVAGLGKSGGGGGGGILGSLLSGFGDYRERAAKGTYQPMQIGDGAGGGPGTFIGAAAPRIRHREYIGNVFSSIDFKTTVYPIQIGVNALFPWLSTMADSFQQYRIHGMELYFESTCSNVSATTDTRLGTVMMSTQYEVIKPPLSTTVAILNSEYTTSEKPTEDFYHPIECDPNKTTINNLYTRTKYLPQTSFTDMGNFQVSTEGMQADGVQLGKLWCTYDVELIKPTLPDTVDNYAHWSQQRQSAVDPPGNLLIDPTFAVVLANTFVSVPIFSTAASATATYNISRLTFPKDVPGQYLLSLWINTTTVGNYLIAAALPGLTNFTGLTFGQVLVEQWYPGSSASFQNAEFAYIQHDFGGATGVQTTGITMTAYIDVPGGGGSLDIDIPCFGFTSGVIDYRVVVVQVPPAGFAATEKEEVEELKEMCSATNKRMAALEALLLRLAPTASQALSSSPVPSPATAPIITSDQTTPCGWQTVDKTFLQKALTTAGVLANR